MFLDPYTVAEKLLEWVEEDAPFGDLTTGYTVPRGLWARAVVVLKSRAVPACLEPVVEALRILGFNAKPLVEEAAWVEPPRGVLEVAGEARRILLFERTLLNLLIYTFSVATTTRMMVEAAHRINPRVRIAATRKTPPGLRYFAKCAVAVGGGDTHRLSLSDAVLVKDNHVRIAGSVAEAVRRAKARTSFAHRVEVEVSSLEEAVEAIEAGADIVMIDNQPPEVVAEIVGELGRRGLRDRVLIEASGGIDLSNVADYAATGVDIISSSMLTMSPVRVDLSLRVVEVRELRSA
ncbi:Nicotinate-nucleotide pyrophosphorylase [Hyperthermus butylicus DSM 5456]|uniref:Nicotinate-nucleotide pyrophosphorylase [carboxylating] n=1 Tax=Hyperthermus butylicus (strain DSM 5456 / JCM 9403 / PLM1-5) TaxID=415426 RepID=A2BKM4_HYPBU|nr:Nicotinate-nucleotide pyrophosphorylase [Hyperthermus butylicus DSM 5456]